MGFISAPVDNPIYRYAFSTSSASGVREVQKLLRIISEKLESGEDHHPIINFKSEPFMSRGMKNLKPVFDIKEWSAADVHQ